MFAACTLVAGWASADAIGPRPAECPAGSTPDSDHFGPFCRVTVGCDSSEGCDGGACVEVKQCLEKRGCNHRDPSAPCNTFGIVGPCGEGDSCSRGTCTARSVCRLPEQAEDDGCSCEAAGGGGSSGGSLLLVLGPLIVLRRRQ